jgi:hypothetical protein
MAVTRAGYQKMVRALVLVRVSPNPNPYRFFMYALHGASAQALNFTLVSPRWLLSARSVLCCAQGWPEGNGYRVKG